MTRLRADIPTPQATGHCPVCPAQLSCSSAACYCRSPARCRCRGGVENAPSSAVLRTKLSVSAGRSAGARAGNRRTGSSRTPLSRSRASPRGGGRVTLPDPRRHVPRSAVLPDAVHGGAQFFRKQRVFPHFDQAVGLEQVIQRGKGVFCRLIANPDSVAAG